jgi:hypothetical protein
MKSMIYITFTLAVVASFAGCATGGTVAGNGNATGGNVSVGPINADVTPCINLPGSTSRDCKTQGNGSSGGAK